MYARLFEQPYCFRQQIDLMYARCDLDGDGRLDYDEFKRLILRQR
jgi:Ca2+-binding EF-hand superfamily protein